MRAVTTYRCLLVFGPRHAECAELPVAAGMEGDSLAASWVVMRSAPARRVKQVLVLKSGCGSRWDKTADALVTCDGAWMRINGRCEKYQRDSLVERESRRRSWGNLQLVD